MVWTRCFLEKNRRDTPWSKLHLLQRYGKDTPKYNCITPPMIPTANNTVITSTYIWLKKHAYMHIKEMVIKSRQVMRPNLVICIPGCLLGALISLSPVFPFHSNVNTTIMVHCNINILTSICYYCSYLIPADK